MSHKLSTLAAKYAANSPAYALGEDRRNGFHIRKVVWGRTLAIAERRTGSRSGGQLSGLIAPVGKHERPARYDAAADAGGH